MLHDRRPLGHRPHHANQVAGHLRVHRRVLDAGIAADDHERRVATLRLVERADAVADAGRAVQLHERRPLRRTRVAVGRQHGDRLLQRQDVFHLRVGPQGVEEPLLNRARVPEHVGDAVGEELLDDGEVTGLVAHGVKQPAVARATGSGKYSPGAHRPVNTFPIACYQP